jgi:hypothetical protein
VSSDNANWIVIQDSTRGHALNEQMLGLPPQAVRFVRIVDYFDPANGTSTGRLDEVEIFGAPQN